MAQDEKHAIKASGSMTCSGAASDEIRLIFIERDDIPNNAAVHSVLSVIIDTRLPRDIAQISGKYLVVSPDTAFRNTPSLFDGQRRC